MVNLLIDLSLPNFVNSLYKPVKDLSNVLTVLANDFQSLVADLKALFINLRILVGLLSFNPLVTFFKLLVGLLFFNPFLSFLRLSVILLLSNVLLSLESWSFNFLNEFDLSMLFIALIKATTESETFLLDFPNLDHLLLFLLIALLILLITLVGSLSVSCFLSFFKLEPILLLRNVLSNLGKS